MKGAILLIDDDSEIRRMLASLLTPRGYHVAEAENGSEALNKVGQEKFSLIILDYNMPVMDGATFLIRLREDHNTDIPVLMMSGNTDEATRKYCYKLGVFDFIAKPESADIILARVENGMKIAELLNFRREIKMEMRLSSAILKSRGIPEEIQRGKFGLKTLNESYLEIGGDIAFAFGTEGDKPVFMIGDVTGHGISAALFSILIGVAAQKAYRDTMEAHRIIKRLNRELAEYLPGNYFVTMFCCCYDTKAELLHYVNAGHPPPFIYSQGECRELESSGYPALGIKALQEFKNATVPFRPGDWLLMYTDGMIDVFHGKEYIADNFVEQIAHEKLPASEMFNRISEHVKLQDGFIDDRTLMLLTAGSGKQPAA